MTDQVFMARALELARRGRFTTAPNPNVGCVIVRDGQIVGEGWHQRAGEPHAEVHALRAAGDVARGATAYVTLEPCSHFGRTPPCCDALIAAGVSRVVAAMQDPNPEVAGRGLYRLRQAGIEVSHGLMQQDAEALNRGFLKRMRTGFPWVQLKLGASLDGRTAMASGESQWITSAAARRDVQHFRAQSHAILSTAKTVIADNAALTVRAGSLDSETLTAIGGATHLRQPVRVIADRQQQLQPSQSVFSGPGDTWLIRSRPDGEWPETVKQIVVPEHDGGFDLVALMMQLGRQQINSVWTEAGATLAGALIRAGVVDELIVYLAPKLLGNEARGLCALPGLTRLADAPAFCFEDVRRIGDDLRVILRPE